MNTAFEDLLERYAVELWKDIFKHKVLSINQGQIILIGLSLSLPKGDPARDLIQFLRQILYIFEQQQEK